jgi:glycosyltransferase involved in cell wall biosynthesis
MRVLQFGRFWGDNHGGVERHVHLLSKGLAAQGVDVVNLVASQDLKAHDEWVDGFRLVQAPSFGMAFRTAIAPALIWKAMQLHREKPFDIFHLHFQDPLTHLVSLLLPRDVKRVITWHHDIVRQMHLLKLYLPFLQRITRQADAVVAATPAHFETSKQIPRDVSATRHCVIPYGLDHQSLVLNERTALIASKLRERACGRGLIFALGRHVAYKGFGNLIKAMRHTSAFLMLGGSGPLTTELQKSAAQFKVQDRLLFCGRIPEEDLAAYFHACDIFCLPSTTEMEAFGLVQLEAMSCGKPVVCTELNNGVNFVNVHAETGLAVPVGDALAMGQAFDRLLSDAQLRERLGQQAYSKAHNQYSISSMTSSHTRLYQDLLSASR